MTKINVKTAAFLLGKAVAGNESFVYTSAYAFCEYFKSETALSEVDVNYTVPRCIVGKVIDLSDVPNTVVRGHNFDMCHTILALQEVFTGKALRLLSLAQQKQDAGYTWGAAASWAMESVDNVAIQIG
jgi:hypothetical protein